MEIQSPHQTSAIRKFLRVEPRTVKYKIFYFIFFFGSSAIRNYLPVYFRYVGMNAVLTGVLTSIRPFTRLISAPLCSAVADKTGKYKLILMVSLVVSVVAYFSLSFVMIYHQVSQDPQHANNHSANVSDVKMLQYYKQQLEDHKYFDHVDNNSKYFKTKTHFTASRQIVDASPGTMPNNSNFINITFHQTNQDTTTENVHNKWRQLNVNKRKHPKFRLSEMTIFWTSLILVALGDFFTAPVGAIMSATIIYWEGSSAFGGQRVFGALGFGIGSYLTGIAIDRTSGFNYFHSGSPNTKHTDIQTPNYLTAFFIYLGVNIILILLVKFKFELMTESRPRMVFGHLKILLRQSGVIYFLLYIMVMGISGGIIMLFLFWFLEDLGGSQTLLGLSSFVMSLSEIPVFPACSFLIRKLGHVGVLFLSLTCFIIRLLCYTFLHNPWYVLLIEPLHGVTLAIMWSTCISFASVVAPPEIYTTMEGVIAGVHYGLGWGLGVVIGGVFYHHYGARNLFRGCLVLCGLCFPLLGVVFMKVHRDTSGNIVRYETLDNSQELSTSQDYEMIAGNTYA